MKKLIFLFTLYVLVFFIFLGFCQNTLLLSLEDTKPYTSEINFIVNDYNHNFKEVKKNIDNYIDRIEMIKNGFSSLKRPYVLKDYFKYKLLSLEKLELLFKKIKTDSKDTNKEIVSYNQYNGLSEKEIKKILENTLIRVTHFNSTSYYKPEGFSLQAD